MLRHRSNGAGQTAGSAPAALRLPTHRTPRTAIGRFPLSASSACRAPRGKQGLLTAAERQAFQDQSAAGRCSRPGRCRPVCRPRARRGLDPAWRVNHDRRAVREWRLPLVDDSAAMAAAKQAALASPAAAVGARFPSTAPTSAPRRGFFPGAPRERAALWHVVLDFGNEVRARTLASRHRTRAARSPACL